MDTQQFDSLARIISSSNSRRKVARWLLGGALGAAVGLCRGTTRAGNGPCAHFCVELYPPGPERGDCISAAARGEGLCSACGSTRANVCYDAQGKPYCPNLLEDPLNCGGCGIACTGGQECVEGVCRCPADPCLDPANRARNPTTCACECSGTPCPAPQVRDAVSCLCACPPTSCEPPWTELNPATCACECPPTACPTPQTALNPTTCQCECPAITCDPPQTEPNPSTCACECPSCSDGGAPDPATCACDGACICTGGDTGDPCESDADCCFSVCEAGVCDRGDGCTPVGSFCDPDIGFNLCCSGLCVGCQCACIEGVGTGPCTHHENCCAGACFDKLTGDAFSTDKKCCVGHGNPCVDDADCCSDNCDGGACGCAAEGHACGSLLDAYCCDGLACAWDAANARFVCAPY